MEKPQTILIAGAGIGGLTLAAALAQNGANVHVFERAAELGEVGAGLQQSPNAMHVHEALGTAAALKAVSFAPEYGALRDYKTGAAEMRTQMQGVYETRYGQPYLNVHRADLHKVLEDAARDAGAQFHLGVNVLGYEPTGDKITLMTDQGRFDGDVVVGADGIHSNIQKTMLGGNKPNFTKQVAWRGCVAADKVPDGLIPPAANNWMGPGRHFVSYYVKGGALINFVAVEERDEWAEESWQAAGDMDALRTAFAGWDAPVTALLNAVDECFLWGLFDRPPLPRWHDGRAALLGDAAHPMLPFMAQGASMAIEDAWVLAHKLLTSDGEIPAALSQYEAARKPRATAVQAVSRNNAKLYHQRSFLGRLFRKLKFRIGALIPALIFARLDKIYGVNVVKDYPIPNHQNPIS